MPHAPDPALMLPASQLAWIPLLPLSAFVLLILAGRRLGALAGWLTVASLAGAGLLTARIAPAVFDGATLTLRWAWLLAGNAGWTFGLAVDGLSWVMLAVVTSIGTLIAVYSIGYMQGDARFSRYFAYFSLFCASMLGLVMADHFVLLFACWELVGLCSYLLISFWFEKPDAAAAGRKAFITTRIGDTGLLLGIFLLAASAGTLSFRDLAAVREALRPELLTLISSLVFLGAVGKSAQVPLHVWLPDAMEGPTPVSARIHAATQVAAGVYLLARTFPLFTPESLALVLAIGLATHLLAGTVALTMTDIKRVLAYSTISQLGLMMTALGLGAVSLAMFHLAMHACCKALLFLGAGSVIHGTHQQDLAKLGGLRRTMPVTWITFLIAALSLSGAPLLSGFWSKDAILLEARHVNPPVFWALTGGALLTSAYLLRLFLRCFHGSPSPDAQHAHRAPFIMALPLAVLAAGAAGVGLVGTPWAGHVFFRMLAVHELHEGIEWSMLALSGALVLGGAWLAWTVGVRRRNLLPRSVRPLGSRLYALAVNKYYVDEFFNGTIIAVTASGARWLAWFDQRVIDGAVNVAGLAGARLGFGHGWWDRRVIDALVNGLASVVRAAGIAGRRLQTGLIQQYLLVVVAAAVVLSLWLRP